MTPDRIVSDLVEMVARAPGFSGFYNGVNAGASLPGHLHYQLFQPPEDHRRFPLETEGMLARTQQPGESAWRLGKYVMESMHWYGEPKDIAGQFSAWIKEWADHQEHLPDLTANILAISEPENSNVSLFFVPRDRKRNQAEGLAGKVGGLEVLGELVLSTGEEEALLESGQLDYFILHQILSEVCTPLNMP